MQAVVFALVATTFLTIYVTQPVLPVLKEEFGVTPGIASCNALRQRNLSLENYMHLLGRLDCYWHAGLRRL